MRRLCHEVAKELIPFSGAGGREHHSISMGDSIVWHRRMQPEVS